MEKRITRDDYMNQPKVTVFKFIKEREENILQSITYLAQEKFELERQIRVAEDARVRIKEIDVIIKDLMVNYLK